MVNKINLSILIEKYVATPELLSLTFNLFLWWMTISTILVIMRQKTIDWFKYVFIAKLSMFFDSEVSLPVSQ